MYCLVWAITFHSISLTLQKITAMIKEYFSHDYDPISDIKMMVMVSEWGGLGYGFYWRIVELLHKSEDNTFEFTPLNTLAIAKQMKVDAKQITAFVDDCVNVFELFKRENNKVFCDRVFRNIGKRKEISEVRKAAGSKGGAAKAKQSVAIAKQNIAKEKKVKEIKEKEKKDIIIADANASENYKKFFQWGYTDQKAIRVFSMEQPLTPDEFDKLLIDFNKDDVFEVILSMENYKDLLKKNLSANLTIRNWLSRKHNKQ